MNSHYPINEDKHDVQLQNWYLDQITLKRKKYFLFTNSLTLFSFFTYFGTVNEIQSFSSLFREFYKKELTRNLGFTEKLYPIINKDLIQIKFTKTNSRSILGSMNDFKFNAEARIERDGLNYEILDSINYYTNRMPMGYLKYKSPLDIHKIELENICNYFLVAY